MATRLSIAVSSSTSQPIPSAPPPPDEPVAGGVVTTTAATTTLELVVEVLPKLSVTVRPIVNVSAAVGWTVTVEAFAAPLMAAPVDPALVMVHASVEIVPPLAVEVEVNVTGAPAVGVGVVTEMAATMDVAAATAARTSSMPAPQVAFVQ